MRGSSSRQNLEGWLRRKTAPAPPPEAHAATATAATQTTSAPAAQVTCHHQGERSAQARAVDNVLIFVVARTRLDRYEELRRQFENWRDVSIILDRREGDRRTGQGTYVGVLGLVKTDPGPAVRCGDGEHRY